MQGTAAWRHARWRENAPEPAGRQVGKHLLSDIRISGTDETGSQAGPGKGAPALRQVTLVSAIKMPPAELLRRVADHGVSGIYRPAVKTQLGAVAVTHGTV